MFIYIGLKGFEPSTVCLGNISSKASELQAFKRLQAALFLVCSL